MHSTQYPLQVPDDLMDEVEQTAKSVHLSKADVMRQSIKLGLPRLRRKLTPQTGRITNVEPLPKGVLEKIYEEREDDEVSIRRFINTQPKNAQ